MELGATGIVFGDIGTSPLYAFKEALPAGDTSPESVLGILSLIIWALLLVVTLKYILVITRLDNEGQGGTLVLSTLAQGLLPPKAAAVTTLLGIIGLALFSGDCLITPAISVLSAVEGVGVVAPDLAGSSVPIAMVILVLLYMFQARGTETIGFLFGPIMVLWFTTMGVLGLIEIWAAPQVLLALDPRLALNFLSHHSPWIVLAVLGGVTLAVTGCEALYADMGHFGRRPICRVWFWLVLPALCLCYLGQGALVLTEPTAASAPFFLLAPSWGQWPLLALATAATVIASQAVISGAFSLGQQACRLGYLPRREIRHTSRREVNQVYIPRSNWMMLVGTLILVLGFRSSDALAGAYGIAVTGAMAIDTLLATVILARLRGLRGSLLGLLMVLDLALFGACLPKFFDGGWVPMALALASFISMDVWRKGRRMVMESLQQGALNMEEFVATQVSRFRLRVPGTVVVMTSDQSLVPVALLHNIKHNRILHDCVITLTVRTLQKPRCPTFKRYQLHDYGHSFYGLTLKFGYMETPDVPAALARVVLPNGQAIDPEAVTFMLSKETIVLKEKSALGRLRGSIFIALSKTTLSAAHFFNLPAGRVLELGAQVCI